MQTLRIFISSPGDVRDERQIAGRVIERLQGKYWSFVRFDDVFWEERAVRSTAHYQDELINPGKCELVVGILGTRLGSPLPAKFAALSGSKMTGTEWELEEAFTAYDDHVQALVKNGSNPEEAATQATPDILIYRRKPVPARETLAPAEVAQLDQLEAYLREHYAFPDGTIKRPVLSYRSHAEFEENLTKHLEELILKRLPGLKPGFEPPPISGCPFKGLSVFTYDDSDRFFGRNRQIREVQDLLQQRAKAGKAFVLIYGASGYGKSSLMRAGLAPVLTRPGGAREGMDRWRRVIIQSASGTGSLCERLARALLSPSTESERELAKLHEHYALSGFPELVGHPISDPDADGSSWDVASLARYLSAPEDKIFAVADLVAALAAENLHVLLQVDQLEEIFAETVTGEDRAAFLAALDALASCGRIWCLATMRSEYFSRVAEEPELRALLGRSRDGGYILPPPDWQSWSEIIRFPALAARLDWERTIEPRQIGDGPSTEEWLNEQLLEDVKDNPDSLPLLEFCLERLYRDTLDPADPEGMRRKRDLLTWDSYVAMDGLHGSIATEANQAYEKLSPSAQGARDYLFGNLVRVDDTVTRRRGDLVELEKKPGAAAFLNAFREAKLLVTDEEDGRAVITLAHESLLSHWPVLFEWIEAHRSDLAAHQRLIKQAQLWEENKKSRKYLLAEGHLAEAERVAVSAYFLLSGAQTEFLRESQSAARKKLRRFQGASVLFALLAIAAGVLGWVAEGRRVETQVAQDKVEKQLVETQRQLERSQLEEGRTWIERANLGWKEKDPLTTMMLAGRAVGFHGFGRRDQESPELIAAFPDLLGKVMTDPGNEIARQKEVKTIRALVDGIRPTGLPIWSSPVQNHHEDGVSSVAFSSDGTRLASGSEDAKVKLWDVATGEEDATLSGHTSGVTSVAFSPDGTRLASGSEDAKVKLWDVATGKEVTTISGHTSGVTSVAFSPDGTRLASGSEDAKVKLWDVATGKEVTTISGHTSGVTSVAFSPDGTLLVSGSGSRDRTVKLWDLATGKDVTTLSGHTSGVTSVAFSPDGTRLASGSEDKKVKLWDVATGNEIATLSGHMAYVNSVAFSPDGTRLASGAGSSVGYSVFGYSEDNTVKLWDVATGKVVASLSGHTRQVSSVAFSPDGTRLASGSEDQTVKLWDVMTGKAVAPLSGHTEDVTSVAFCPDGTQLASGSRDRTVKLWDVATGKEVVTLSGHMAWVNSVAFSPDGTRLASGSGDAKVKLWNVATGKESATLSGHNHWVTTVVFSSDGIRLASGSHDQTAKVWDVATGKEVATLSGHTHSVYSVAFSPDG
ncbi:MAG: AAA family ATPase, partial [Verrucomicrobiales bacterium]